MKRAVNKRTSIVKNESQEGKTIEQEIEIMLANGEDLEQIKNEPQFTARKDGVIEAFNIRHDKWLTAQRAMQKVSKSYEAKRNDRIAERETPKENEEEPLTLT